MKVYTIYFVSDRGTLRKDNEMYLSKAEAEAIADECNNGVLIAHKAIVVEEELNVVKGA